MEDKVLTCKDCSTQFTFSVRDQQFYLDKGFENEPQRCRDCRMQRKNTRGQPGSVREQFEAICAKCGVATTVPFKPRGDRPVYCRLCYTSTVTAAAPG